MIKGLFDFLVSLLGLILLFPIFILIAVLIKLDSRGPVFFRQERIGLKGVPFHIHKFRTMIFADDRKEAYITIKNDTRITNFGFFLRKYKLDELPQLIDVFLGKMSIVGPRPEIQIFVNKYTDEDKNEIFSVKPGITDNASIEFRSENDLLINSENSEFVYINKILPIKLNLYREYVRERSFLGDIAIIFKTIFFIFKK